MGFTIWLCLSEVDTLLWSDVDIDSPPDLNDTMLEVMRMNEFLFRPSYKCAEKTKSRGGFVTCTHNAGDALFIMGDSRRLTKLREFARAANATQVVLFTQKADTPLESKKARLR